MRTAVFVLLLATATLLAQGVKSSAAADAPSSSPAQTTTPAASGGSGDSASNPSPDISVSARLVVLATVVRDHKGALVNGLTRDDFLLKVRDETQTIRYFDHDNNVPLTLGLLVDVSRSQRDQLDAEKDASQAFLPAVLSPSTGKRAADTAFIVQFAKEIEMLQDVTDDRGKLDQAIKELGTSSSDFHTDPPPDTIDSEGRHVRNGGTSLYDAIYLAANEVMAKQTNRKALVVLTDGVDNGSKETLADAIEAAQRADTIVYAVYFKGNERNNQSNYPGSRRGGGFPGGGYPGSGYPGGGYPGGGYPGGGYPGGGYPGGGYPGGNNPNGGNHPNGGPIPSRKPSVDGKQVMERICGETGGHVFEVSRNQPIGAIYKQISDELHAQYRIGFTPQGRAASDGFHPIDLSLKDPEKNKKLDVQVRSGYFAGTP